MQIVVLFCFVFAELRVRWDGVLAEHIGVNSSQEESFNYVSFV